MFITNSPAPSRINSAESPQRDVTVWEFAIFGYFLCIIRTVRTRSFNHKHKHRKMAIFCYFFSRFFCSLNWEFSYSNWKKNILFWHWEHDRISVVKTGQKNPEFEQVRFCLTISGARINPGIVSRGEFNNGSIRSFWYLSIFTRKV